MATDMFLKVEGADGESVDSNHTSWTEIQSFSWGASQPGTMGSGGGGGAGKVCYNDLLVTASIDKATVPCLGHCSKGTHIPKVELSVCKAGDNGQVEYTRITLEKVLATAVQFTGSQGDSIVGLTYAFQAAKVKLQYWVQTDKGTKGPESSFTWNIKENKAE